MLPDRVSNPGPLTYESGALPIALRRPATKTLTWTTRTSGNDEPRQKYRLECFHNKYLVVVVGAGSETSITEPNTLP